MPEPFVVEVRIPGTGAEAERIMGLVRRAEQGETQVVPELRKVLDHYPRLWQEAGDLARVTESVWLQQMAGTNAFLRESVSRRAKALRRDLLGDAPTPLERLLVDRVVCTWLGLHYAESKHAGTMQEQTFQQGEYYQERIVRYQRMHLAAVRALAQLRRVAVTVARVVDSEGRQVDAARVEG